MGSAITIEVHSKTKSVDTSTAVSAKIEAKWGGIGKSASGSAGFKAALSSSKSIKSSTVAIRMSGQNRGEGVKSLELDDANKQLIRFHEIAKTGTGLAVVLNRLDQHPDYIKVTNQPKCKSPSNRVNRAYDKQAEKIIFEELVAAKTLLDWIDAAKTLDDDVKNKLYFEGLKLLEELKELTKGEITLLKVFKVKGKSNKLIKKFQ